MKTPREILLEQHRAAAPKLDTIRHEVVDSKFRRKNFAVTLWFELVLPNRRIWTGLAAIWFLIFVVNFSMRDRSDVVLAKTVAPSSQMIWAQERLLAELTSTEPRVAEPPKTFSPRPSSERKIQIVTT